MEVRNSSTIFKGLVIDVDQMDVKIGEQGRYTCQTVTHPMKEAIRMARISNGKTLAALLRAEGEKP